MPYGPPSLCPVTVIASTPDSAKDTGSTPAACTASVWNGMPCSWATAASSAIGWTVPTSLLAHMMLTSATAAGSCSIAGASTAGCDHAELVHRQQHQLGALVRDQPVGRVEHRVVLHGADQHRADVPGFLLCGQGRSP